MASPIPKRASQRQRRNRTATAATLEALPARRQPLPDVRWSSIVCLVPGCLLAKWQHNRARFEEAQELGVDILAHDFDPKPIAWRSCRPDRGRRRLAVARQPGRRLAGVDARVRPGRPARPRRTGSTTEDRALGSSGPTRSTRRSTPGPATCRFDVDPTTPPAAPGAARRQREVRPPAVRHRRRDDPQGHAEVASAWRRRAPSSCRLTARSAATASVRSGKRWEPVGRPGHERRRCSCSRSPRSRPRTRQLGRDAQDDRARAGVGPVRRLGGADRPARRDRRGEGARDGARLARRRQDDLPGQGGVAPLDAAAPQGGPPDDARQPLEAPIAEPWEMHATTMYAPGEGSVLEEIHDAAKKLTGEAAKSVADVLLLPLGRHTDPDPQRGRLDQPQGCARRSSTRPGPAKMAWTDPTGSRSSSSSRPTPIPTTPSGSGSTGRSKRTEVAFDVEAWKRNRLGHRSRPGLEVIRRDGLPDPAKARSSRSASTARAARRPESIAGPHRARRDRDRDRLPAEARPLGSRRLRGPDDPARPRRHRDGRRLRVLHVWRLYADPPDWDSEIAGWVGKWGKERVVEWFTYRERPIGFATRTTPRRSRRASAPTTATRVHGPHRPRPQALRQRPRRPRRAALDDPEGARGLAAEDRPRDGRRPVVGVPDRRDQRRRAPSASSVGATINQETATRIIAVFRAVQILADTVATLPVGTFRRQGDARVPLPGPTGSTIRIPRTRRSRASTTSAS
jgi:hypothetical protein